MLMLMFKLVLICFGVMCLIMLGMAIGVIFKNKPIAGSCGGMKALNMGTACEICGDDPAKCDEFNEQQVDQAKKEKPSSTQFYEADK